MMIVHWILRRYPQAWRDRYGEELEDIAASERVSPGLVFDLLSGAIDARLHPEMVPSYADDVAIPANDRSLLSWESRHLLWGALVAVLSWLAWAVLGLYAIAGLYAIVRALGLTPWLSLTGSGAVASYLGGATSYIGGPVIGNTIIRRLVRAGWRWQPSRYVGLSTIPFLIIVALAYGLSQGGATNLRPIAGTPCYEVTWSGQIICEYEPKE